MKDNHFKLSNSFTSLFTSKQSSQQKQQTQAHSLDKGLFKLNPKSAHTLEDMPVQIMRKKSKNKLQSLKDQSKNKFSIFNQKIQSVEALQTKKQFTKKYANLNLNTSLQKKKDVNQDKKSPQYELPYNVVPPSKLNVNNSKLSQQTNHSLFQTPLLPCFASQFRPSIGQGIDLNPEFKCVEEKEGVWKIGRIKIKGNKASLNICGIDFDAIKADVSGKAGVVSQDNFYQLNNWKGIWVVQPSQSLFK